MKRTAFLVGFVMVAFIALSQTGTQAVNISLAERFAAAAPMGESGTYNFDKSHSAIGFKIMHQGLIEIPGYFRDFTGTVNYDAKDVSKSAVEFKAMAKSVDTGVVGRDNHLRNADFFEVEKFPEITFKSTKVEKKGKNWMLTGDFTMKGVTKSITFPFQLAGFLPATERGGAKMGFTAETTINRRDYGVNYGSNMPNGVPQLADNVTIQIAIEAPMPRAAAPAATPKAQ